MNFDKQLDVFSRNLSEIRRNGRYSYQAFSEKLRVGKSTVQAIESGGYNITLSTLITIANSLEIHPALLLMDLPISRLYRPAPAEAAATLCPSPAVRAQPRLHWAGAAGGPVRPHAGGAGPGLRTGDGGPLL